MVGYWVRAVYPIPAAPSNHRAADLRQAVPFHQVPAFRLGMNPSPHPDVVILAVALHALVEFRVEVVGPPNLVTNAVRVEQAAHGGGTGQAVFRLPGLRHRAVYVHRRRAAVTPEGVGHV